MQNTGNLTVTTPTEREIAMARVFDAPRSLVFDARTKPELLNRWMYGPHRDARSERERQRLNPDCGFVEVARQN